MNIELIEKNGKQFAVLPLDAYQHLKEQAEMLADIQAFDVAMSRAEVALPEEVWEAIESGVGAGIAALLRYHNMTQQQLAELSGVKQPYISAIIHGQKPGSAEALKNIAAALQISLDDLLDN